MQFIPCSRHVLINKCCNQPDLSKEQARQFRSFAEILAAYQHYISQQKLEQMKLAYAYLSPNQETPLFPKLDNDELKLQADILADTFGSTLRDANYKELEQVDIEKAFKTFSLVPVNTDVDLRDYKRIKLFYRGSNTKEVSIKRFFRVKKIIFENYDRVAVLLHIKDKGYFDSKKDKDDLNFSPGKVYLYLYKNIPHYDLELLFPNVKISMSWKDKMMLGVPALGAAIPMAIKVLPSLGLLVGAVALVVFGLDLGDKFNVEVGDKKAIYPLLVAVLSTSIALGGFAVRQYVKYKSKRLEFLKKVTDVLFFKSLDVSQGTLNAIVDSAEEEQTKEAILVYTLMVNEKKPLSEDEIASKVNLWIKKQFLIDADVNIKRALKQLHDLRAPYLNEGEKSVIEKLPDDRYQVSEPAVAKYILDYIWDHAFQYAN
ncbi:MAG: TMEM143 family protein [Gammaproteobacteria bacterium]